MGTDGHFEEGEDSKVKSVVPNACAKKHFVVTLLLPPNSSCHVVFVSGPDTRKRHEPDIA